jgi:2-haloacid dehalogenase
VVFDIGGVVLDWNPRNLYRKLFTDEVAMERFLTEICTPAWHEPHDRGVPTDRSCAELAAEHPEFADLIHAWNDRGEEMVSGEVPGTARIVRELKSTGMACFALTNMEAERYPTRLERYRVLRCFDGTVVSGFEGIAKPDPAIYQRMLRRFGLNAPSTLMIDDNQANLEVADRLGFQTVRFLSALQLRERLEDDGLLPPT